MIDLLEKKSDNSEQFSHKKNGLLVHRDEKQEQENTDSIVLNITQNL